MRSTLSIIAGFSLLATVFLPVYGRTADSVFPGKVTIGSEDGLFLPVQFDHQLHADYSSCVECHHHTTGMVPSNPYCLNCHPGGQKPARNVSCHSCHSITPYSNDHDRKPAERFHKDILGAKGAYHNSCINCHEVTSSGPIECEGCHELSEKGKEFYRTKKTGSRQ